MRAGIGLGGEISAPASAAPGGSNQIIYIPLTLPWPYPIKRFFVINGAAVGGNFDLGIFSRDGARVISTGSIVQAGVSTVQYVAANYLLMPGSYFLAIAYSSNVARFISTNTPSGFLRQGGFLTEANFPLPSVMTPGVFTGTVPIFGITLTPSGF